MKKVFSIMYIAYCVFLVLLASLAFIGNAYADEFNPYLPPVETSDYPSPVETSAYPAPVVEPTISPPNIYAEETPSILKLLYSTQDIFFFQYSSEGVQSAPDDIQEEEIDTDDTIKAITEKVLAPIKRIVYFVLRTNIYVR